MLLAGQYTNFKFRWGRTYSKYIYAYLRIRANNIKIYVKTLQTIARIT